MKKKSATVLMMNMMMKMMKMMVMMNMMMMMMMNMMMMKKKMMKMMMMMNMMMSMMMMMMNMMMKMMMVVFITIIITIIFFMFIVMVIIITIITCITIFMFIVFMMFIIIIITIIIFIIMFIIKTVALFFFAYVSRVPLDLRCRGCVVMIVKITAGDAGGAWFHHHHNLIASGGVPNGLLLAKTKRWHRVHTSHPQQHIEVLTIKGPDNPTCYVFPKDVSSNVHTPIPCAPCMDAITEHPDAQNAAPATTSATASPKCCACHDFARPPPRARQHPVPLDSCRMLPLPHKHTPRCTECSACHDFGNGTAKVLRLPRFRTPPVARAPTSCPSRQLPNSTPATQTHTQMHRMLRLPRLRQRHR